MRNCGQQLRSPRQLVLGNELIISMLGLDLADEIKKAKLWRRCAGGLRQPPILAVVTVSVVG